MCGDPAALSVTLTKADSAVAACGVNVTFIVQEALGAIEVQLLVWENEDGLVPVMIMPETTKVAPPLLVSVIGSCALEPKATCPNNKLTGLNPTTGAVPVPDRGTVCGEPGASSVKLRFALRTPVPWGVNVTPISQNAEGARVVPQVFEDTRKSAAFVPVRAMLEMLSVTEPVLVSRVESGALVVLTCCEPKARLVGKKLAMD